MTTYKLRVRLMTSAAGLLLVCGQAHAAAITLSSTTLQSGHNDVIGGGLAPITSGSGFNFSGQPFQQLTNLTQLSITLTLFDADSAPDDLDFDKLTLALDGVDTGIVLNGFPDVTLATLTFAGPVIDRGTGMPNPIAAAAILNSLQADGRLVAAINSTDNPSMNAFEAPADAHATLRLTGETVASAIPEPATSGLVAFAAGVALLARIRRNRHA